MNTRQDIFLGEIVEFHVFILSLLLRVIILNVLVIQEKIMHAIIIILTYKSIILHLAIFWYNLYCNLQAKKILRVEKI